MAASRVRSRMLFVVLDALILGASYSLAELVYVHNTHTPSGFAQQVALFLVVALAIQLTANHLFGLYGRMWRHAGIEEARQIVLSSGAQPGRPVRPLPRGPGHRPGARSSPSSWSSWAASSGPWPWAACASTRGSSPGSGDRVARDSGWP